MNAVPTVSTPSQTRRWPTRLPVGRTLLIVGVGLYFAFSFFPFLWTLLMSLKSPADVVAVPPRFLFKPTLENYQAVLGVFQASSNVGGSLFFKSPDFPAYFAHTLIISVAATVASLILGVPAAYGLARVRRWRLLRDNLLFTILSFRFLPELSVLIPLFIFFQNVGLYDTYLGMVWVYQLIGLPLVILVLRSYFIDIPVEVEEAVQVDGGTWVDAFLRVAVPLAVPAIAAAAMLVFIYCWNNFIFAIVLGGPTTTPVTVAALNYVVTEQVALGDLAAASILAGMPAILLAVVAQRYLVRGLTLGAVRG